MEIETTGERVIEDSYRTSPQRYLIYLFHLVTYQFARDYVRNKVVLDYGCGTGYGAHLLAADCQHMTGIDISEQAIEFANSRYLADNLTFQTISPLEVAPLPFPDSCFDTVLSFQVIEHIRDTEGYLNEIRRILRPGGAFVCATPDRSTRLLPGQKPWNVWHVREYDKIGLARMLSPHFEEVKVFGLGGRESVLAPELRRSRRAMWLTLPFTLPFIPEFLRVRSLHLLKLLSSDKNEPVRNEQREFDFDASDLFIAPDAKPSTNLLAVAKNP